MPRHRHAFVEDYDGMVGFGLDRETDELTVLYYLQKISDDTLGRVLVQRMTNAELAAVFEQASALLRRHLSEPEYHRLFLKDSETHTDQGPSAF